jgi:hypothetical protein
MQHPWENRILRKIIEGSVAKDIDFIDVVNV